MSPLTLLPSGEEAAVRVLLDHPDRPLDSRVGPDLPPIRDPAVDLPFVRVTSGGGGGPRPGQPAYWLWQPVIDLHAYAADPATSEEAARTAHAVLHQAPMVVVAGGVLTDVTDVSGVRRLDDPDVQLARHVFTVRLTLHPAS